MSATSAIEWTEATWNPVRGCTEVSAGCRHCYAKTFAERFRGTAGHPYELGFDPRTAPEKLLDPFNWSTPRFIFTNSMSDLFHEEFDEIYVTAVLDAMRLADWHVYQVLTKRAERMQRMVSNWWDCREGSEKRFDEAAPHVWLGVSCENAGVLHRVEMLRATPAAVRFLSCEPLLGPLGSIDLEGIHWVIVGGESGNKKTVQPMHPRWVGQVHQQCLNQDVSFFFKQWGNFRPLKDDDSDDLKARAIEVSDGTHLPGDGINAMRPRIMPTSQNQAVQMVKVGKKRAGRQFWNTTWDEKPPWNAPASPLKERPTAAYRQQRLAEWKELHGRLLG